MKILISGVAGGTGSFMVEYLLERLRDIEIYGLVRQSSTTNYKNLGNFINNHKFKLVKGDITDLSSLIGIFESIKPDYYINFAANTNVQSGWQLPQQMIQADFLGVVNCLEAIRKTTPKCRMLQAGSSEEFGEAQYTPQDEKHPISPRNIYGIAKAAARLAVKSYREKYNIYVVNATCYNNEGRKSNEFVSKIIVEGVAKIYHQLKNNEYVTPLKLGNIENRRDFSHSLDFCDAFWKILNQHFYNEDIKYDLSLEVVDKWGYLIKNIKDYVIASGESHSVREFLEKAFEAAGIEIYQNDEPEEIKKNEAEYYLEINNMPAVIVDKSQFRPSEKIELIGDSSKIRKDLGWEPEINFDNLVKMMVEEEIKNY